MDGVVQMIETIIVAVLSLFGTLAGSFFAHRKSTALLAYRLEELEKKVDKHNQVIERTYNLEERAALAEAEFKRVNHRLEELEKNELEKHS